MENQAFVVPGFLANGIHSGIKETGNKDLSLIFSVVPAKAVGVFTTNCFKAAPVLLDMERITSGVAQVILANSGNANAATGQRGYRDACIISEAVAKKLKIRKELVLVASTGVIGHRLPVKKIIAGVRGLISGLRADGIADAEEAIMTTDKFPKIACRRGVIGAREVTICGMAKGAGMIEPHMATMLAFVMTDADIDYPTLGGLFRRGVKESFNAVTVDGCMSTNDTAIILANGRACNRTIRRQTKEARLFRGMLFDVLSHLSEAMVRDGEGATKIIDITVEGARSVSDARKAAYGIANSNLFKCACFGGDPNWGRVIAAVGAVGLPLSPEKVEVSFGDIAVFSHGQGISGREKSLAAIMGKDRVPIRVHLGMGDKSCHIAASDLSFEYITINAHYHT